MAWPFHCIKGLRDTWCHPAFHRMLFQEQGACLPGHRCTTDTEKSTWFPPFGSFSKVTLVTFKFHFEARFLYSSGQRAGRSRKQGGALQCPGGQTVFRLTLEPSLHAQLCVLTCYPHTRVLKPYFCYQVASCCYLLWGRTLEHALYSWVFFGLSPSTQLALLLMHSNL